MSLHLEESLVTISQNSLKRRNRVVKKACISAPVAWQFHHLHIVVYSFRDGFKYIFCSCYIFLALLPLPLPSTLNHVVVNFRELWRNLGSVHTFRVLPRDRHSARHFNIMSIVADSLTGRMGDRTILPVKLPITTSTTLNFDGTVTGTGKGVGM